MTWQNPSVRSHPGLISLAALLIGSCTAVVAFSWLHGHRVPVAGRELFLVISIGLAGTAGVISGGEPGTVSGTSATPSRTAAQCGLQAARQTAITLATFRTGAYRPATRLPVSRWKASSSPSQR